MKKTLFVRIMVAVMVVVMMVMPCISASAFSVVAPGSAADDDNYYSVVFEDGVLTVKVNPDKVYAMLKDGGDLTKDELMQFVPAEIRPVLEAGKPSLDDIKAIVANYITPANLKDLVDLLPVEVVAKYFSIGMLTDYIALDEIVSLLAIDQILARVEVGAVNSLIGENTMDLVLTEKVEDALLSAEAVQSFADAGLLNKDNITELVSEEQIKGLIDSDVLCAFMDNDAIVDAVFDTIELDETINDLVFDLFVREVIGEGIDRSNALAVSDYLENGQAVADVQALVKIDADVRAELVAAIEANASFDSMNYWNLVDFGEFLPMVKEDLVVLFAEDRELLVKLSEVVGLECVVDALGGYSALITLYTPDEYKAIAASINKDKLSVFYEESGIEDILKEMNYKALVKNVVDFIKENTEDIAAVKAEFSKQFVSFMLADLDGIYINEEIVYEAGSFDVSKIFVQIIRALPNLEDLLAVEADGDFAQFVIEADIAGTRFAYGVKFGFMGDPTNLQEFIKGYTSNFDVAITEAGAMTADISVVFDVYKELLESDELSDEVKAELIGLFSTSIEDLKDVIAGYPKERIAAIVNALDGKLDAIKNKAYAAAEKALKDKAAQLDGAKAYIDSILNKFTSVENLVKAQKKLVRSLNSIPAEDATATLIDRYTENGTFNFYFEGAFDLFEMIEDKLPEAAELFFTNTEFNFTADVNVTLEGLYKLDLVLADGSETTVLLPAGISLDILEVLDLGDISSGFMAADTTHVDVMPAADTTLYSEDLYSVQFVAGDEVIDTVIYVFGTEEIDEPAIPEAFEKLGYTAAWGEYELNETKRLTVELEYEAIVYKATFVADGKVVEVVDFTVEDETIDEPEVPAKEGYTGVWEDYTLEAKDITINAVYTAIEKPVVVEYTATFVADGKVVAVVKFTAEDKTIDEPDVPAKTGYTGAWEDYKLEAKDITINAVYTAIEYTATFKADGKVVGTVKFTVETKSLTEPAVPEKTGYVGAWEKYTLEPKDITINAIYTAEEYEATFVADGKVVAVVKFTVEDNSITEPAVPAKEGYTGVWEEYKLEAKDITINAIYTAIDVVEDDSATLWIILVIVAVVIAGAAVGVYFYMKNKNGTPPTTPDAPVDGADVEPEVDVDAADVAEAAVAAEEAVAEAEEAPVEEAAEAEEAPAEEAAGAEEAPAEEPAEAEEAPAEEAAEAEEEKKED